VVSPDGKHVYVAAQGGGVTIFDRSERTGALRAKRGRAGCVSQTVRLRRHCRTAAALKAAIDVAVSPDGRHLYVAALASDAIAVFRRDRGSGALTQPGGRAGCVAGRRGPARCARARALDGPLDVDVSPDGRSVYGTGYGAIVVLDRDRRSGALTQKPGAAGCVVETLTALGGCRRVAGPIDEGGGGLALSADGRSAYVAAGLGVSVLARDSEGTPARTARTSGLSCR
jgi:DNA-binding beta-propeller fold protein YncE